ncbi:hypothetical protein CHS0354_021814 [Potamilus streckersoni]|uniref:Uncharacterized protein n=1 Tax=Potamilus streckersoni TaxID=2493646 RepID=A0AAE0S4I7_9BIVA|nr:hypothetical protein CHS0354_021814 [Potamilus streckersoni]
MVSDLENENCNTTFDYERLHAPMEMDGQDELMCPKGSYQASSSQCQDQDDSPEDFCYLSVPDLLTGIEEKMDGNAFILQEEARKGLKRKHSELCYMDDLDMEEEQYEKVHIIDGLDICETRSLLTF